MQIADCRLWTRGEMQTESKMQTSWLNRVAISIIDPSDIQAKYSG